jgi:uncharacterized protein
MPIVPVGQHKPGAIVPRFQQLLCASVQEPGNGRGRRNNGRVSGKRAMQSKSSVSGGMNIAKVNVEVTGGHSGGDQGFEVSRVWHRPSLPGARLWHSGCVDSASVPSRSAALDAAFQSPTEHWVPLSPRLITARRITLSFGYLFVVAAIVVAVFIPAIPLWYPIGAGVIAVLIYGWAWWIIGRRVRSYGYVERDEDLQVVSGILIRRLVVVPYGRMQIVDLTSGPLDRWLGIATVQLHTAAATTDAAIPGLPPEQAAALRDRLAARGEERSAGM